MSEKEKIIHLNVVRIIMLTRLVLSVVSVVFIVGASSAKAEEGIYLSGLAGVSLYEDSNSSGSGLSVSNDFQPGYAVAGALGYLYGNGFRAEVELSHRSADIGDFNTVSAGGTAIALGNSVNESGSVSATSVLFNAGYEMATSTGFTPYVLGGVGVAHINVDNARVNGVLLSDSSDSVLAYQVGVGSLYKLTAHTSLDLSYRFFDTENPSLRDSSGAKFESELQTHNVMLGMRYRF
jgi:opacity protein-like surface antigen